MSIPKQLFQTWKTKNITNELKEITGTWQQKNKNYKYFLYDDDECENFIKNNFDNDVLSAYKKIIIGAFKADLWRVCILYQLGGFYNYFKIKTKTQELKRFMKTSVSKTM